MKKIFLVMGLLLSLTLFIGNPNKASAAIAFDGATGLISGSGSSQTISHTVSGSNTFLVVSTETGYPGADDVTNVTYNGVAMSRLFTSLRTRQDFIYYLINPSPGTHDVVISLNRSADSISTTVTSYNGVSQLGQPSHSNNCASDTCSVTTTVDSSWLVGSTFADSTYTQPSGQIARTSASSQLNVDKGPVTTSGNDTLGMVGATGQLLTFVMSLEPVSIPDITGSGTTNRLVRFTSANIISDALFYDNGVDTTLTSGNLFFPSSSMIDSSVSGSLNFGIATTTTMVFGRSGQNMIINSNVGIGTTTPTSKLFVNGDLFASWIKVSSNGFGLDTLTSGALSIGSTTANAIRIGRSGITTTIFGTTTVSGLTSNTVSIVGSISAGSATISGSLSADATSVGSLSATSANISGSLTANSATITNSLSAGSTTVSSLKTTSNCASSTSPAVCGSAPSGSVAMATGGSTLVVNTTTVTANSQIIITEDSSLGARLGLTCNTTTARDYRINARVASTSFTIKSSANPTTNKACLSYWIIN